MLRVPLPFRGVAVLLLAASTVVGQTPEPPAELTLDPTVSDSPDFLRQYSADTRHPLLHFMVDGELTSFDGTLPQGSSRLTPTPDTQSKTPATEPSPHLTEVVPDEIDCPTAPDCLPFACPSPPPPPPPCYCRKCQRRLKHAHCGNYGPGCGNPYLGWPGGCPGAYGSSPYPYAGCGSQGCRHKHGCGSPWGGGYGVSCCGYGGGCGMMGGCDGFMDGGFCGSCMPYMAPPPPPPPPCFCHKCRRKYGCGGHGGYGGYGGYGGGYGGCAGGYGGYGGMGCGGFMDGCFGGCFAPPPPPPPCHRCLRKHGCSYGYGYAGCGYPCWPAYPVPGANMVDDGCNRCHGLFHRCRGHHHMPPYPYYAYPSAMPCMAAEPFCDNCAFGGDFGPDPILSGTCQ